MYFLLAKCFQKVIWSSSCDIASFSTLIPSFKKFSSGMHNFWPSINGAVPVSNSLKEKETTSSHSLCERNQLAPIRPLTHPPPFSASRHSAAAGESRRHQRRVNPDESGLAWALQTLVFGSAGWREKLGYENTWSPFIRLSLRVIIPPRARPGRKRYSWPRALHSAVRYLSLGRFLP